MFDKKRYYEIQTQVFKKLLKDYVNSPRRPKGTFSTTDADFCFINLKNMYKSKQDVCVTEAEKPRSLHGSCIKTTNKEIPFLRVY